MSTALGASGGPGGVRVQRWSLGFEGRVGSGLSEPPPNLVLLTASTSTALGKWLRMFGFGFGEGIYFLAPDGGIDSAQRVSEIS